MKRKTISAPQIQVGKGTNINDSDNCEWVIDHSHPHWHSRYREQASYRLNLAYRNGAQARSAARVASGQAASASPKRVMNSPPHRRPRGSGQAIISDQATAQEVAAALSKASLCKVSRRCRECALYWRGCPFATCPLGRLSATEGFSSRISRNIYFMPVIKKRTTRAMLPRNLPTTHS